MRRSNSRERSSPSRWKKYSLPSSAAMKPNPRSETSFLMVPVVMPHDSFFSNVKDQAMACSRKLPVDQTRADRQVGGTYPLFPISAGGKRRASRSLKRWASDRRPARREATQPFGVQPLET